MKLTKWCLGIVCVAVAALETPKISGAFEIQLTQEQVKEAREYGAKYKGKDVFESDTVKSACFGEYPTGEGGLVMSKYIRIAVTSAMMTTKDKTMSDDDVKEIKESSHLKVVLTVIDDDVKAPEDAQIILQQGTNNILPQKVESGMKYKNNVQSVIGIFQEERVNPRANTTIMVKTRKGTKKYSVDFSDIK